MYTSAAIFALAASAIATPLDRRQEKATPSKPFGLTVTNNDKIEGWVVKNAHVDATGNFLTINRPSAYTPDKAFLNGTIYARQQLVFNPYGDLYYETILPYTDFGERKKVVTTASSSGSASFYTGSSQILGHYFPDGNFSACPEQFAGEEVFLLEYGLGDADRTDCLPIDLRVNYLDETA